MDVNDVLVTAIVMGGALLIAIVVTIGIIIYRLIDRPSQLNKDVTLMYANPDSRQVDSLRRKYS